MRTKHLLVVDDDAGQREAISEILEISGYHVATAANGLQALEVAATTLPPVIVLDLHMPVMDGWQVIDMLRQDVALRDTPIIVVSGESELPQNVVALSKPFRVDHLLKLIEWAIDAGGPSEWYSAGVSQLIASINSLDAPAVRTERTCLPCCSIELDRSGPGSHALVVHRRAAFSELHALSARRFIDTVSTPRWRILCSPTTVATSQAGGEERPLPVTPDFVANRTTAILARQFGQITCRRRRPHQGPVE